MIARGPLVSFGSGLWTRKPSTGRETSWPSTMMLLSALKKASWVNGSADDSGTIGDHRSDWLVSRCRR